MPCRKETAMDNNESTEKQTADIREWAESHPENFFSLFDTTGAPDGEGVRLCSSNHPKGLSARIRELEYKGRSYAVARGEMALVVEGKPLHGDGGSETERSIKMGKIKNIKEWEQNHSKRQYLLFDTSEGGDGEGRPVIMSNRPDAFLSFVEQLEFEGKSHCVARGVKEPAF